MAGLTYEQIQTLEAGQKLDELVLKHVFPQEWKTWIGRPDGAKDGVSVFCPRFSRGDDWNATWRIVTRLRKDYTHVAVVDWEDTDTDRSACECHVGCPAKYVGVATTVPVAICKAALFASLFSHEVRFASLSETTPKGEASPNG